MKIMFILFFFTEIGREKDKNLIFYVIFLNSDISISILDIVLKCRMLVPLIHPEGSVSQIFYFGPSLYFICFSK